VLVFWLFLRTAGPIGGNRAPPLLSREPAGALVELGPPFGNQHVGVMWRQVEAIPDCFIREVDAVNHVRILPKQAD
jgi:hypothetical protein